MDLGATADGIERALVCGGVPLELYRRPGFTGGMGVRHANFGEGGSGVPIDAPDFFNDEARHNGRASDTA
jgi:hypothetical protein